MSPSTVPTALRIPVVSGIAGMSDAVCAKLQASSGPAGELFRAAKLELVDIPAPLPPSAGADYDASTWQLDDAQLALLKEASIMLGDAHRCAPILLTPSVTTIKLPPHQHHAVGDVFKNLRWMQATFAGVDTFQKILQNQKIETPSFLLTRAGGVMTKAMAQYVLGWIISLERNLLDAKRYQDEQDWNKPAFAYRYFPDLTVGILGHGDIGQEIGRLTKAAGFKVLGFKRNVKPGELQDCADRLTDKLEDVLTQSDFIVSVLPSTAATRGLLNEKNLALCQEKKPVFINVGRGDLVSEAAVLAALDSGWLSRAVLDVFAVEPLPKTSALWTHPKVHITPHTSANSFPQDVANVFVENLDRHLTEQPLRYPVDWSQGY